MENGDVSSIHGPKPSANRGEQRNQKGKAAKVCCANSFRVMALALLATSTMSDNV